MQANHIKENNYGIDEDEICKSISRVKLEYEAEHERNIEYLAQEYDDYKSPWKEDAAGLKAVADSSDSGKITFAARNPVARKEPITDTQTLKEPIKGSHLGKIVCHSESESTDMDPIVTEFGFIGKGGPRAISGESHTQIIIQGGGNIVGSDVITHVLTNPDQVLLECESFSFNPLKAQTLVVASLVESFLTSNGNVRLASVIGESGPIKVGYLPQG